MFDRIFHITRGGISKASRGINLSEDIFAGNTHNSLFFLCLPKFSLISSSRNASASTFLGAQIELLQEFSCVGFNSTLRRGNLTNHEYIQVGKGRFN